MEQLGRVAATDGQITYEFPFMVAGKGAVVISNIEADCACAVAEFPKDTLQPGTKGKIKVVYSPYRPGPFEKKFILTAQNAVPSQTELILEGVVIPEFVQPSIDFPHVKGNFRFPTKKLFLGNITNEAPVKKIVEVYNHTDRDIELADSVVIPSHIELAFENTDRVFKAKQVSRFTLYYHPELKKDYGSILDNILILNKKTLKPEIDLDISVYIRQYFPPEALTNPEKAPKLGINIAQVPMGRVNMKQTTEYDLILSNTGQSDLSLLKIAVATGCETTSVSSYQIAPGKYATIKIRLSDTGVLGPQTRTVQLFTNDPFNSVQTVVFQLDAYLE